jgi:hypothetical protein
MRAHRGNVFDELFDLRLIPELLATAVWARTELDLNILIDRIGLVPEGARMSGRTPRPLGRYRPFSWLATERSHLTVRLALGRFERLFRLGEALCFGFQLLVQRSVFGPQGFELGRHLGQTLSLPQRGLE